MAKRKRVDVADAPITGESAPGVEGETEQEPVDVEQPQPGGDLLSIIQQTAGARYTVKYTGPLRAVLGGEMILSGETRRNVRADVLARAQKAHPGEFAIVG